MAALPTSSGIRGIGRLVDATLGDNFFPYSCGIVTSFLLPPGVKLIAPVLADWIITVSRYAKPRYSVRVIDHKRYNRPISLTVPAHQPEAPLANAVQ